MCKLSILILEDDPNAISLYKKLFKSHDTKYITMTFEALYELSVSLYDIIIVDSRLHYDKRLGTDFLKSYRQIHKEAHGKDIRIIVITAFENEYKDADEVYIKPLSSDNIKHLKDYEII